MHGLCPSLQTKMFARNSLNAIHTYKVIQMLSLSLNVSERFKLIVIQRSKRSGGSKIVLNKQI